MPSWKKSTAELRRELNEQQEALGVSCKSFDNGNTWEAKRLASIVHMLVHDKGRTTCLLTQLGIKSGAQFLASARACSPTNLLSDTPLVGFQISAENALCYPLCTMADLASAQPMRWLPFSRWWDESVLKDQPGRTLSRKNLVFSLRDQDGGSHVDPTLTDEAYTSFARKHGAGWWFQKGGVEPVPVGQDIHRHTMRQVAWEVSKTLEKVLETRGGEQEIDILRHERSIESQGS